MKLDDGIFRCWTRVAVVGSVVLVVVVLLALSTVHERWGYDEYGAAVSHIELDDPIFAEVYITAVQAICPQCPDIRDLLTKVVLPVLVVPIRWTYALGISPLLGLARVLALDWQLLKPLLLLPSVLLSGVGLWLAVNAAAARGAGPGAQLTFIGLVSASPAIFWWINTFSSYAHHLLCFGLLAYATLAIDNNLSSAKLVGRAALMRAAAPLLNYQYMPIVAVLGLLDMLGDPRRFVFERRWLGWIVPAISCTLSAVFLVVRADLTGKHVSPTTASLTAEQVLLFSFPQQANDISSTIQTLAGRYADIVSSFYAPDTGKFTEFGVPVAALCVGLVGSLILLGWRRLDRQLFGALTAMLLGTMLLHFTGVMPLSPSRHQLVMFAPLCLGIACLIERILGAKLSTWLLPVLAIGVIAAALINQAEPLSRPNMGMPVKEVREALEANAVQRIVLAPCELEPLLYPDLRAQYAPLYRCGPRVVNLLPAGLNTIAVWSGKTLTDASARTVVADFSEDTWHFRKARLPGSATELRGSLYIAQRFDYGRQLDVRP